MCTTLAHVRTATPWTNDYNLQLITLNVNGLCRVEKWRKPPTASTKPMGYIMNKMKIVPVQRSIDLCRGLRIVYEFSIRSCEKLLYQYTSASTKVSSTTFVRRIKTLQRRKCGTYNVGSFHFSLLEALQERFIDGGRWAKYCWPRRGIDSSRRSGGSRSDFKNKRHHSDGILVSSFAKRNLCRAHDTLLAD